MTSLPTSGDYFLVGNEEEYDEPIGNVDLTKAPLQLFESILISDDKFSKDFLSSRCFCSSEYIESLDAIELDCWDISSWIIFLEEVEQGRAGGKISVIDAYNKIISQYPLSAMLWKKIVEFYIAEKNFVLADEALSKCLTKCRNVALWQSYIFLMKINTLDTMRLNSVSTPTLYSTEHAKMVAAFERALENIGSSLTSGTIWQDYIIFVRNASVFDNNYIEVGKKLSALRSIFQRAVCVPMDCLDGIWNDYELFEKASAVETGGEDSISIVLAEFNKRYLHAKSIYRDRKRLTQFIEFDRFACPPTHSFAENQQLELWNRLIIFELGNPDNLDAAHFRSYIRMLYDQFLCCFCYNAEVWLSLAQFVWRQPNKKASANEAREVYRQGIECNQSVSLLRVGLAELEELEVDGKSFDGTQELLEFSTGNLVAAEQTLREAFSNQPGGFTFTVYQRFVRRHHGKLAARKLFGSTLNLRNTNPKLGFEIFMAHARLEEEVNCDLITALRVFDLIREKYPSCLKNTVYVRSLFKVLITLGHLKLIQWIYQTAVGYQEKEEPNERSKTLLVRGNVKMTGTTLLGSSAYECAKFELELVDAYLHAETVLNKSSVAFLNIVRDRRSFLQTVFDELDRMRYGSAITVHVKGGEGKVATTSVFDSSLELVERYAHSETVFLSLSEKDRDLKERSANGKLSGREGDDRPRNSSLFDGQFRRENEVLNMTAEFHLSLAGLPVVLRDLLSKLPLHNGSSPDIEGFVRHIKSITLPPRPTVEDSASVNSIVNDKDSITSGWLLDGEVEVDETNDDSPFLRTALGKGTLKRKDGESSVADQEDLFRKRQRLKVVHG